MLIKLMQTKLLEIIKDNKPFHSFIVSTRRSKLAFLDTGVLIIHNKNRNGALLLEVAEEMYI